MSSSEKILPFFSPVFPIPIGKVLVLIEKNPIIIGKNLNIIGLFAIWNEKKVIHNGKVANRNGKSAILSEIGCIVIIPWLATPPTTPTIYLFPCHQVFYLTKK